MAIDSGPYQLVDFGEGEKLESFAGRLLRRPSPAAAHETRRVERRWRLAHSVFQPDKKRWKHETEWPKTLMVDCGGFAMPIAPTPFGHVGLFPEQQQNWKWLRQTSPAEPGPGLNLFAYTGASSIAMAVTGMPVVHVDAAKANVGVCRAAAAINRLDDHPIRYLVDDAGKFVARELRRGKQYHTIILDPPAYGHAPNGKAWRLERDLWPLLENCLRLLNPERFRVLLTGHSPQVGVSEVMDYLQSTTPAILGVSTRQIEACTQSGRLVLYDEASRGLDAGFFVRVDRQSA